MNTDDYACPICHEILLDPRTLPCGHNYCGSINGLTKPCIEALLKNRVITCALDYSEYKDLNLAQLKPNIILRDTVRKLRNTVTVSCEKHTTEKADLVCTLCDNRRICIECLEDHLGHKLYSAKDHEKQLIREKIETLQGIQETDIEAQLEWTNESLNILKDLVSQLEADKERLVAAKREVDMKNNLLTRMQILVISPDFREGSPEARQFLELSNHVGMCQEVLDVEQVRTVLESIFSLPDGNSRSSQFGIHTVEQMHDGDEEPGPSSSRCNTSLSMGAPACVVSKKNHIGDSSSMEKLIMMVPGTPQPTIQPESADKNKQELVTESELFSRLPDRHTTSAESVANESTNQRMDYPANIRQEKIRDDRGQWGSAQDQPRMKLEGHSGQKNQRKKEHARNFKLEYDWFVKGNRKSIVKEVKGNLFNSNESLAHCVGEDFVMSAGIAIEFRKRFPKMEQFCYKMGVLTGGVAPYEDRTNKPPRWIYNLVTKKAYNNKPTQESVNKSLEAMRGHAVKHGVKAISMPMIGRGLNQLRWDIMSDNIDRIFADTGIGITVCYL